MGKIKLSHSLRSDIRFYYTEDMRAAWSTPFEFRLRYMESWSIPVSRDRMNKVVLVDEVLSAVDKYGTIAVAATGKKWSPWQLTENRFSLYYRRSFSKVDLDLGVMHQYWREKPGISTFNTSYNMMFDVIVHDPFSREQKKTTNEG